MKVVFTKRYISHDEEMGSFIIVEPGDTGTLFNPENCMIHLDDIDKMIEYVNQGCFTEMEESSELEEYIEGETK